MSGTATAQTRVDNASAAALVDGVRPPWPLYRVAAGNGAQARATIRMTRA